ncbi:MAG: PAS domain-containing protein, partial [Alicyclobacillus sp.]|nr:PAS domain-containing protein [Alicyclobacillus sp.]
MDSKRQGEAGVVMEMEGAPLKPHSLVSPGTLLEHVLNSMDELLIVLDPALHVTYMNRAARELLNLRDDSYMGRHFFDDLRPLMAPRNNRPTIIEEVLASGIPQRGIRRRLASNRLVSMNIVPLLENGRKRGVLLTGQDITDLVHMEEELDLAFALTLPNSKVEHKLKTTPEFADRYDPVTGKITILSVIEDGGYRHVINALRIFAALRAQGVTEIIGIEKDLLVQALIFHDLGKSQPNLRPGDVVHPREVLEESKL